MLERAAPVLFVQGFLLLILAIAMLVPLWLIVADGGSSWQGFATGTSLTAATGLLLVLICGRRDYSLTIRQMFALTCSSWGSVCLFAALPLYFGMPELSFTDAVFEAVSGVTATGGTVLTGLDTLPRGILLWRGLLQWLGGIGIVVFAIAILPFLSIGGMRLFKTESSDWSDKVAPRSGSVAKSVGSIYVALTLLCGASYWLAGMQGFDAVVHAMTTVATGGYANYDASYGVYADNLSVLWIGIVFMIAGALPFTLYVALVKNRRTDLFRDQQVRGFIGTAAVAVVLLFAAVLFVIPLEPFALFTHTAFNVISILSTTGYASVDYTEWGAFAIALFFFITFIGGCSGSTSGGLKIFRLQIAMVLLNHQLKQLLHGQGVFTQKYNNRRLSDELISSITAFSFFFLSTIAVLALALSALGLDLQTAISGAASAVANVGPGLGPIIGPAGTFASVPDAAKWLLSVGMLLGRLEIMTLLVLLTPAFWRW
ncbi:MAG: TrkH family potassium uptake protein [Spongiibacteraceae bacterium]|jgi:trk system potassium uptake protein TrkH|nr:TrkH family potassium uptake protein [Spongiibacteraceae bacterium]